MPFCGDRFASRQRRGSHPLRIGSALLDAGGALASLQVSSPGNPDPDNNIDNGVGGSGDDRLIANAVRNVFEGGDGADTLVFRSTAAAGLGAASDQITDFTQGQDLIRLTAIDANTARSAAGDQAFTFAGEGTTFTGAGQRMYHFEMIDGVEHAIVEGNVNADLGADFRIDLVGHIALTKDGFQL